MVAGRVVWCRGVVHTLWQPCVPALLLPNGSAHATLRHCATGPPTPGTATTREGQVGTVQYHAYAQRIEQHRSGNGGSVGCRFRCVRVPHIIGDLS